MEIWGAENHALDRICFCAEAQKPKRSTLTFDEKMRRVSTSEGIVLGMISIALGLLALAYYGPMINKEPPIPRHLTEMPMIVVALQSYYNEFMTLPKGTTDEIMNELYGHNPRKIAFLEKDHPDDPPIADSWGTPYKVTTEEGMIRVSSAGQDGKWNTADDIKKEKIIEQEAGPYGSPAAGSPSGQP